MPRIDEYPVATYLTNDDTVLLLQNGLTKLALFSDIANFILPAASIGGNSPNAIVTTTSTQDLRNKTLHDIRIVGQTNEISNAVISASTLLAPQVTGGSFSGGTHSNADFSNSMFEFGTVQDCKLIGCTVYDANGDKIGSLITDLGREIIMNKDIRDSNIAPNVTLGGQNLKGMLDQKAGLVGTGAVTTTIMLQTNPGVSTKTVTDTDIIESLALQGISTSGYTISALDIHCSLYMFEDNTYSQIAVGASSAPALKIGLSSGEGKNAVLKNILLSGLSQNSTYALAITCRIVARP